MNRVKSKIAAWFGGYDMFISYRHKDAYEYAKELERVLESEGLLVFRDESEEDVGTPLQTFIMRARAARTFVILVTPSVYGSSNVLEELNAYLQHRVDNWFRRPFSRVIPINVANSLNQVPKDSESWKRLVDFVYEEETLQAVEAATPSTEVVERLKRSSSFLKSWQLFSAASSALILVAVVASIYLFGIRRELSNTQGELSQAQTDLKELTQEIKDAEQRRDEALARAKRAQRSIDEVYLQLSAETANTKYAFSHVKPEESEGRFNDADIRKLENITERMSGDDKTLMTKIAETYKETMMLIDWSHQSANDIFRFLDSLEISERAKQLRLDAPFARYIDTKTGRKYELEDIGEFLDAQD